jgi:large subunit ribosomal protein L15
MEEEQVLLMHHLRPAAGSKKKKMRVGRGDGSKGKTAGRGTKGTKARSSVPARFEGGQMPIHMRLPKLHGFKNPFRKEYQVVNLSDLEKAFADDNKITVDKLVDKGLVRKNSLVKVLGDGDVKKSFEISVHKISASALKKLETAGGKFSAVNLDSKNKK